MDKTTKRPVLKKIYFLMGLMLAAFAAPVFSQNISWLQGNWQGSAYVVGNDPSQNYDLVLTISKVKGKNFEGVLKTMKHTDTTLQSTSKVTGIVNDLYLFINIAAWKVACGNCKPQNLAFSMESGRFTFKGEAKGCSAECTWITVFSRDLHEFDDIETKSLNELAKETPASDTAAVVENTPPPIPEPVVVAPPPPPPVVNIPVEKRIPILAAGPIVITKPRKPLPVTKPPVTLNKNLSVKVKENAPVVIPRVAVLPAGEIVAIKSKTVLPATKPPVTLNKNLSVKVKENAPVAIPRIAILPAGEVVAVKSKPALPATKPPMVLNRMPSLKITTNPIPPFVETRIALMPAGPLVLSGKKPLAPLKNPPASLNRNQPYLLVKINPVVIPERKVPISIDTLAVVAAQPVVKIIPPAPKPPPVVIPQAISLLPPGYNDRKISVVRTLTVNTDSITLNVYDNGIVDGDIVSVVYNDKTIVDKLSLKSKALVVKIPVGKVGINKLVFYAHNLGEYPPNTAQLDIYYGNKKEELLMSSDLSMSSAIDIVYQP